MKSSVFCCSAFVLITCSLMSLSLTGCGSSAASSESVQASELKIKPRAQSSDVVGDSGKGMAAFKEAAAAGKYLFFFFYRADDDQTLAMRKVFDKAMEEVGDRAQSAVVNITDPSEKEIATRLKLDRAPMPLALAIAPNGAITGGFPTKFGEQQLLNAFATHCTEKVMKAIQDGKLVFLCVQNDKTKSNDAALQGVREFKADTRFAGATELVMLDPADPAEASFLADLKIDPKTEEAVTAFLAPPGAAIAKYEGATDKEALVSTLQKASSGCCPGGSCGPGGCAPRQ